MYISKCRCMQKWEKCSMFEAAELQWNKKVTEKEVVCFYQHG